MRPWDKLIAWRDTPLCAEERCAEEHWAANSGRGLIVNLVATLLTGLAAFILIGLPALAWTILAVGWLALLDRSIAATGTILSIKPMTMGARAVDLAHTLA